MKPFSAIIFDMDGVLVDSEPLHQRAFENLFAELGLGDSHEIRFADYYGRSDRVLLTDFIALHRPTKTFDQLLQRKIEIFLASLRVARPIYPELLTLIPTLAQRHPLAIASSNNRRAIDAVLEISGFSPHFSAIVSLEEIRAPKPDPDVYLQAALRLGIDPSDCLAVEDAAAGIEAAKMAGMNVLAITTSLPAEKLARADRIVRNHSELSEVLLNDSK